eukprot:c41463_g1_i1 orf=18-233(+)
MDDDPHRSALSSSDPERRRHPCCVCLTTVCASMRQNVFSPLEAAVCWAVQGVDVINHELCQVAGQRRERIE